MGSESVEEMSIPILRKKPAVAPDLVAGHQNQAPGNTDIHSTEVENHQPDVDEILKAALFGWIPKAGLSNRRGPGARLGGVGKIGEAPQVPTPGLTASENYKQSCDSKSREQAGSSTQGSESNISMRWSILPRG